LSTDDPDHVSVKANISTLLNSKKSQTESALFLKDLQFKEKRETSLLELSFERKKGTVILASN
jgi:hypothetical protein